MLRQDPRPLSGVRKGQRRLGVRPLREIPPAPHIHLKEKADGPAPLLYRIPLERRSSSEGLAKPVTLNLCDGRPSPVSWFPFALVEGMDIRWIPTRTLQPVLTMWPFSGLGLDSSASGPTEGM